MKNIILTNNTKVVNGTELFQVQASDNIHSWAVLKGDVGGWICKGTYLEDSWVDQSSSLIKCHVENSFVLENSDISDCNVSDSKLEQVSAYDSKIQSVLAVNSTMRDSKAYVSPHEADTKSKYHIHLHNSKIVKTEVASTEKTLSVTDVCAIIIKSSTLDECAVRGKDIVIFGCQYPIYNTTVEGTNIKLKWIDFLTRSKVIGKDINIEHFCNIDSVTITVDEMVADGKEISMIKDSTFEGLYVKVMGDVHLNKIDVSRSRRFVVEAEDGKRIRMKNCSFKRRVQIQGEHFLIRATFNDGITLKGKATIKNVFAENGMVRFSGDVDVVNANLVGRNIRIEDMASVMGHKDNRIELGEDTKICEFATVTNQESAFSIKLEGTTVNGESVITA